MLTEQISTKVYAGTATTATKRYAQKDVAVYRLDSSPANDETSFEIRYRVSTPRRVRFTNIVAQEQVDVMLRRHTFNIKGVRRCLSQIGWQDATVNLTVSYDDVKDYLDDTKIKDLVAEVVNIPLASTMITKLLNEEV